MDRARVLQFILLASAVPLQMLISSYMNTNEQQRHHNINSMVHGATQFKEKYLTWASWKEWCVVMLDNLKIIKFGGSPAGGSGPTSGDDDPLGECPAREVMQFEDPDGHFASSPEPRSPRPALVKYRVGQVIQHRQFGYRGVIIGWDPYVRAPTQWIATNHEKGSPHLQKQPSYLVLVDSRDRDGEQTTYIVQDNIEIISNTQILHSKLNSYFEVFEGAAYLPRPWLKALYPHDY